MLRLLGLDDFRRGLAGHEFCAPAFGQVAGEFGVPIILELLDLVRRPALRHADERVGDRALGEIIELPELAAQRDVDRHQHLLHRRIAVDPVGAHVARPVDDVARRIVDRGQAFEHLLISRRIDVVPSAAANGCGVRPQSSITRLMVAPSSCCSAQSWPERVRWQYSVAASMTNMSSSSARSQVFQRVMPAGPYYSVRFKFHLTGIDHGGRNAGQFKRRPIWRCNRLYCHRRNCNNLLRLQYQARTRAPLQDWAFCFAPHWSRVMSVRLCLALGALLLVLIAYDLAISCDGACQQARAETA